MKILNLDLQAYGPFTGRTLDFTRGNHGLHLVYGPNEAGKSAALRALIAFFYGIHPKTPDNFVHDYDALRIGARLKLSDGTERFFIRRKGSKNTLLDESGNALSEGELARFLDDVSQDVFTRMYGIDSSSLVEGGKKLAAGEGELGAVLFAAASGFSGVREIITELEAEAAALFKPTGTTPVINRLTAEYRELKRKFKEHSLSGAQWAKLEERMREAVEKQEEVSRLVREKTAVLNRRKRMNEACKDADELREIQTELEAMAGAVVLPEGFTVRRERAEERLKAAGDAIARDTAALKSVREEIASLRVPDDLLAHRARITALFQESGNYKQAGEQLPRLKETVLEIERDARRVARELRLAGEGVSLAGLCLRAEDRARIEDLCEKNKDLVTALEHQNTALAKCTADLAEIRERLAGIPAPRDIHALENLLKEYRRSGVSENGVAGLHNQANSLAEASQEKMDKLGLKGITHRELLSLPVPGKQTVARFSGDFTALKQRIGELERHAEEERSRLRRIENEIRALKIQGDIPTEEQLIQVRTRRDDLWRLIRAVWDSPVGLSAAQWDDRGGDESGLPEAFEHAVSEADEISDRLRRESDRVVRLAQLVAGRESSEQTIGELMADVRELMERKRALEQKWSEVWKPAGITPGTPGDMSDWLIRYDEATALCREWRARSAELEEKVRELSRFRDGLQRLTGLADSPAEALTLSALDGKADDLIRNERDADIRRKDLQDRMFESQRKVLVQEQEVARAKERLEDWKVRWAKALVSAGLDSDASPDQARAVLRKFDELAGFVREIEEKSSAIKAIESRNDRFEKEVQALCADLGRDMPEIGYAQFVEQLNGELQEGLKIRERLNALAERQRNLEKSLEYHRGVVSECDGEILALLKEAHCDDPRLLPGREAVSAAYREKAMRADELRRIISRSAGGSDLEVFLAEVASVDADALPQEISDLEREIEDLEKQRSELNQEIGRLDRERDEMAGGSMASQLSEEMESVLAGIKDAVLDYARLTLAASKMRGILEHHRKKSQGRVLTRAGEFFRRMTLDSLQGLAADFDSSDRQVLVGLRNGGRVHIEAMSEGTCDQLYLALRLASLEQRLEGREPMPLILDDILASFDDIRAAQTLKILAELSGRTQVILFTHHRHLCDLASGNIPPEVLCVHEL
ncbi:MAG TPA: AAA family ATPase [Deltaproteobacteria bacterium]|nr:AAA family ATPase [Deltaproteobacteria bacterium]